MVGYIYVHISNAGRHEENPSFDGHGLTLAYKFWWAYQYGYITVHLLAEN